MAINENLYAPLFASLPELKSVDDYQNEAVKRQGVLAQLGNYNLDTQTKQLALQEAQRKQDVANQTMEIGKNSIVDGVVDKEKFYGGLATVDPIKAIELQNEDSKYQVQLKKAQNDELIKNLDYMQKVTDFSLPYLNSSKDEASLQLNKELAKKDVLSLGRNNITDKILQGIDSWTIAEKDNIINRGLSVKDQLALQRQKLEDYYKANDESRKDVKFSQDTTEFNQKQQKAEREASGILSPQDQQKAISDIQSARQTQKNSIQFDKGEQAYSDLNSFFGKDKKGNIKYRYANNPTGVTDVRLLVNAIKADDPSSTVTENEINSNKDTNDISSKFGLYIDNLRRGKKLTEQQALELYKVATNKRNDRLKNQEQQDQVFIKQAQAQGLDLSRIFTQKELKRYKLDNIENNKQPPSPFSFSANVPPPAYAGQPVIADSQGNVSPLNKTNVTNANQTQPTIGKVALPTKFTDLSMEQRKAIQQKASAKGYTPQEYYKLLRGG